MNKEELLQVLTEKVATGEISRGEIINRLENSKQKAHFSLTKIFYVLGALVTLVGIIFFIRRIWDDIGSPGRIFVTLGLGLILAGAGSVFLKSRAESRLGQVFHALAGFLIPGGAMVALDEIIGLDSLDSLWPVTIVSGAVFLFYLVLTLSHRNEVLSFFAAANGTAFVYLLVESMIDGPFYRHDDIYAYLTMIIGLSYLLLAHSFRGGWNKHLVGIFNFLGAAGFLGAAFSRVFDSVPWQWLFFALLVGGLSLAVYLKSRSVLAVSVLFRIAHFIYIPKEYVADSIGWPISLVVLGFLFIGLGYISITINKKYISSRT
ncbi:MAG: hypothetical protein HY481_01245 [Candidatus Vogelbacteria bacterium]|nr:hypothetical protein [Candidatus Vogelbacteria bacterium]